MNKWAMHSAGFDIKIHWYTGLQYRSAACTSTFPAFRKRFAMTEAFPLMILQKKKHSKRT